MPSNRMIRIPETNTAVMKLQVIAEPEQMKKITTGEIIENAASVFCSLLTAYCFTGKKTVPITVESFRKELADQIMKLKIGDEIAICGKLEVFPGKKDMKISIHIDNFLEPKESTIKKTKEFFKTLKKEIS